MTGKAASKQRLLIVDDSKVIRVTARKILSNHFDTVEAVDGENAWELLNGEDAFTLVVSDLTMPNLDGFGLLERIRNSLLPQIRDIPVIIITGANDTEATMNQASQAGATDFISKPFDSVHLLARTQAHASSQSISRSLQKENAALEQQVTVDALTGLGNETAFMGRGYQQLAYAIRHNTGLSIARIEIDDYGDLFLQYGKTLAESVVLEVAKTLNASLRQEDTAARIGTARFSLLLPDMDRSSIRKLTERLSREVGTHLYKSGNNGFRVTISIGVASPPIRRDTRLEDLLAVADRHLAFALSRGGNQVICEDNDTAVAMDNTNRGNDIESFIPGISVEHIQADNSSDMWMKGRADDLPEPLASTFAGPVPDNPTHIEITKPTAAQAHLAGNTGHAGMFMTEPLGKPAAARKSVSTEDLSRHHAHRSDPRENPDDTAVHYESIIMQTTASGLDIVYEEGVDNVYEEALGLKRHSKSRPRRAGILRRMWYWLTRRR